MNILFANSVRAFIKCEAFNVFISSKKKLQIIGPFVLMISRLECVIRTVFFVVIMYINRNVRSCIVNYFFSVNNFLIKGGDWFCQILYISVANALGFCW